MHCDDLARELPAWADDPSQVSAAATAHVRTCLRCQASAAQYRRLRRVALELRQHTIAPTLAGLAGVLETVATIGERSALSGRHSGRQFAHWGGIAVLTAAAGVAGVLVVATRTRRSRLAG